MAIKPLISWDAPSHFHTEKHSDWYWAVGLITLALAAVSLMFGQIITGILIIVAAVALVLHVANPPRTVHYEINDRGVVSGDTLYPFLSLESFWIPNDEFPPKLILKSHKTFMPYVIILIDGVDSEEVRTILLKYISETMHHEHFLTYVFEWLGF